MTFFVQIYFSPLKSINRFYFKASKVLHKTTNLSKIKQRFMTLKVRQSVNTKPVLLKGAVTRVQKLWGLQKEHVSPRIQCFTIHSFRSRSFLMGKNQDQCLNGLELVDKIQVMQCFPSIMESTAISCPATLSPVFCCSFLWYKLYINLF